MHGDRVPLGKTPFARELWAALGGADRLLAFGAVAGVGELPSAFRVSDLAAASFGMVGLAAAELVSTVAPTPRVVVDRALASRWFDTPLHPVGWALPSPWDPLARNYRARDGVIRLHTNAPKHRAAALAVLGVAEDYDAVRGAVAQWDAVELESAVVAAGGCAGVLRSVEEWRVHPQGRAVAEEPPIGWSIGAPASALDRATGWRPTADRPLQGLRVLDLTRVLAGPAGTRVLAALGAHVLRVDPLDWDEPALVPEMTLGKHTARLDAKTPEGLERLRDLIAGSDVLVHGYRSGALERLGVGESVRAELRPGLVEVSLTAYGPGPWADRRGFDSVVQLSSGIADRGMRMRGTDEPVALPVQALDQATGYLLAAAAIRGVTTRLADGRGRRARTSLARVAALLVDGGEPAAALPAIEVAGGALETPWGPATLLPPPVTIAGAPLRFERAPRALGSDPATW